MPQYQFRCPEGHVTERMRRMADRHDPEICSCGKDASLIISIPHCVPDGVYSYAPNIGSASAFEQRREHIKNGGGIIPKIHD